MDNSRATKAEEFHNNIASVYHDQYMYCIVLYCIVLYCIVLYCMDTAHVIRHYGREIDNCIVLVDIFVYMQEFIQ